MTFKKLKEKIIDTLKSNRVVYNVYLKNDRIEFELFKSKNLSVGIYLPKYESRHYYNKADKKFSEFIRKFNDF